MCVKDLDAISYYFVKDEVFHVIPVFMRVAVTYRSVDKPAQITTLKFPSRTLLFLIGRAVFNYPAGFATLPGFVDP